jgi:plasmid maintenance system antidote protein VapI
MANATNRWLDKLAEADKAKGGTGSDYRLSQMLGVARQQVSKWRNEVDHLSDERALVLAEQLGIHPMIVVAEIHADRSRDVRMQRMWAAAAAAAKKAAYAGAVILTALHSPVGSEAAALLCILC